MHPSSTSPNRNSYFAVINVIGSSIFNFVVSELKVLCLLVVLQRIREVDESERAEEGTLKVFKEVLEGEDKRV
jgi:hypothetical protein